jgi:enoyl-CoA hydratase
MDFVKLEIDGSTAVITLDRPKALNALNKQVLSEMSDAIGQVAANKALRALIVTGAGEKAFVAGADIAEMANFSNAEAMAFGELGHRVLDSLEALHIPVIAAVNGFALGGGTELALACDFIYASERAKFGLPEVTLAVIPGFGGTQRLTRVVGRARAKEMIFTGDMIDAVKAKEIGLALDVLPAAELLIHCKKVAATIAKRGPLAVAQAKRVIDAGADLQLKDANAIERDGFARLFGTADQKEGMAAFVAKRPAEFKNA